MDHDATLSGGEDPEDDGDRPEAAESSGAAHDGEPSNVHPLGNGGGKPLSERAADQEPDPDAQIELFQVREGKKIGLGQLVKPGTPIETRYALTGKSISNVSGGIIDPYATSVLLLADCVVDHVKPTFIRDENQKVEKVILYVTLKPRRVQDSQTEAGLVMLREAGIVASKAA